MPHRLHGRESLPPLLQSGAVYAQPPLPALSVYRSRRTRPRGAADRARNCRADPARSARDCPRRPRLPSRASLRSPPGPAVAPARVAASPPPESRQTRRPSGRSRPRRLAREGSSHAAAHRSFDPNSSHTLFLIPFDAKNVPTALLLIFVAHPVVEQAQCKTCNHKIPGSFPAFRMTASKNRVVPVMVYAVVERQKADSSASLRNDKKLVYINSGTTRAPAQVLLGPISSGCADLSVGPSALGFRLPNLHGAAPHAGIERAFGPCFCAAN